MDPRSTALFEWFASPQNPCTFARKLALFPSQAKWQSHVFEGTTFGGSFSAELTSILDEAAAAGKEVAQAVFPNVRTTAQIADLIVTLCNHRRWYCEVFKPPAALTGSLLVGLRWILPGDDYANLVLGVSRINSMPRTRHAPHTALLMRLGRPGQALGVMTGNPDEPAERRKVGGRIHVHLADVPHLLRNDEQVLMQRRMTTNSRKELTQGDSMASAAHPHITFSLPRGVLDRLRAVIPTETSWLKLPKLKVWK